MGVVALRGLWEMEHDETLRAAYAEGLRASAALAAQSLPLCEKFDVDGAEIFNADWRVMNEAWKPQSSEADAVAVAIAGLRVQERSSPRLVLEKNEMREPLFAAVPERLHGRWTLIRGSSRQRLPPLVAELGQLDLFLHDSRHTARNVLFELEQVWPALSPRM